MDQMDIPAVILLCLTDDEYAAIVDTDHTRLTTTYLQLEIQGDLVRISRASTIGQGQRFEITREKAVKIAKLILWHEERRLKLLGQQEKESPQI